MVEIDNVSHLQDNRLDIIETLALELSDNPKVKNVVQRAGTKIAAIREIRTLLLEEELKDYRERISQIPDPNQPVTRAMLDEAVDAILKGVQSVINEVWSVQADIIELKDDMADVKNNVKWMKDDIEGLKAEFSNAPNRREFKNLKTRVQKLEKASIQ